MGPGQDGHSSALTSTSSSAVGRLRRRKDSPPARTSEQVHQHETRRIFTERHDKSLHLTGSRSPHSRLMRLLFFGSLRRRPPPPSSSPPGGVRRAWGRDHRVQHSARRRYFGAGSDPSGALALAIVRRSDPRCLERPMEKVAPTPGCGRCRRRIHGPLRHPSRSAPPAQDDPRPRPSDLRRGHRGRPWCLREAAAFGPQTSRRRGASGSRCDMRRYRCAPRTVAGSESSLRAVVVPVGAPEQWFSPPRVLGGSHLRVIFFGLYTPLQGAPTIGHAIRLPASVSTITSASP